MIAPEQEFFDFMSLPTVSEQMAFAFDELIMTPAIENMLQVSHQTDLFVEKLAKFNKQYASGQLGKTLAFEDSSYVERGMILAGGILEPTVDGVATLLKGAGNILHDGFDLMQRSTKFAYQVGTYLGEGDTQGALDLVKAGYNEKLTGLFKTIEGFEQRYDEASAMVSLVLQNKRAREALMSSLGQAWEDTSQASMFIQGGGLVIEVALALATSGGSTAATLSNNARRATGLIGDVADAVLSFGKSLRGVKGGATSRAISADDLVRQINLGGNTDHIASSLARQFTHSVSGSNSGSVILGRWSMTLGGPGTSSMGYIDIARRNGGTWFESSDSFWPQLREGFIKSGVDPKLAVRMADDAAFKVNEQFLFQQAEKGMNFKLVNTTPRHAEQYFRNSATVREIDLLNSDLFKDLGYVRKGNSWVRSQ